MRLVYMRYSDGSVAVEQTDDNGNNRKALRPNSPQGDDDNGSRRVTTYIVVSLDDTDAERQHALDALGEIREELSALQMAGR